MDWSKVDAALAAALDDDDASRRHTVFIHLAPQADPRGLVALGVDPTGEGSVRTATLSAAEIGRLSDRAEVDHIRISRPLRPSTGT